MDELIKQGQWWWLLAVPVATGGFALFGSWWGSRLGKTTEHTQWLRNEKIETYSHYVETVRRGDIEVYKMILGAITAVKGGKVDFEERLTFKPFAGRIPLRSKRGGGSCIDLPRAAVSRKSRGSQ